VYIPPPYTTADPCLLIAIERLLLITVSAMVTSRGLSLKS